jgi:hypothetical protein
MATRMRHVAEQSLEKKSRTTVGFEIDVKLLEISDVSSRGGQPERKAKSGLTNRVR